MAATVNKNMNTKTLKQNQSIVSKIEDESHGLLVQTKVQLITTLRDYVNAADYVGVKSKPKLLVSELCRQYQSINQLSDAAKKDLFLCIIGNFIASAGSPPQNVMDRFCNQFIEENK